MKKFIVVIIMIVASSIGAFIIACNIPLPQKMDSNILIGIITVSTVLCGFAINNQSILINLTSNEVLIKLNIIPMLNKRQEYLSRSIIISSITFIFALISLVATMYIDESCKFILSFLVIFCTLFQICSIIYFANSYRSISSVMNIILDDNKKISGEKKNKMEDAFYKSGIKS